jgi:hypothetical protein
MSEIESLASRVQDLTHSVDRWNTAMIWALIFTAIAAIGVVLATRLVVTQGKKLADAQTNLINAKDAQLARDLKSKDLEISTLNERTAKAELALAQYKAPRDLTPEQQEKLLAVLRPFAGQSFACASFPDPESLALLRLLDTLAKSSGWKRVPSQIERPGGVLMEVAGETAATIFDSGVDAYIAPDDQESVPAQMAFCSALRDDGIQCETHRTPQLAGKRPKAITISVGKKP